MSEQDERSQGPRRKRWRARLWLILSVGYLVATVAYANRSLQGDPVAEPSPRGAVVFTAAGDAGMGKDARATFDVVGKVRPDFHLALGDHSYAGRGSEPRWCQMVTDKVGRDVPIQLVAGNHEDDSGQDGHIGNFARCLPDRMSSEGEYATQYWFDVRDRVRVIVISPDLTIDGHHYYYGEQNEHYRWLSDVIDQARTAGIRWVVVAMHKNCLSIGEYYCNIYQDLLNLLVSKNVDLVLQAHDHTYQRTKQLGLSSSCPVLSLDSFNPACVVGHAGEGRYGKGAGAVFVVVGTAGGRLYRLNDGDPDAGYMAKTMGANREPRKGVLKVVATADELRGQFLGSTDTSGFGDRFTISAGPSQESTTSGARR